MCYDATVLLKKLEKIEARHGKISIDAEKLRRRYNLSAFENAPLAVLTRSQPFEVEWLEWGFVPPFAKTEKDAAMWNNRSKNCRADTLLDKLQNKKHSMFKPLLKEPVVILLDGFKEWRTEGKRKIPYYIYLKDGMTFGIAGMMTRFRLPLHEDVHVGTTLCTIAANPLLAWIHNKPSNSPDMRMPAIIDPEHFSTWLDTKLEPIDRLSLLQSYPASEMEAHSIVNFKKRDTALGEVPESLDQYEYEDLPSYLDGGKFD